MRRPTVPGNTLQQPTFFSDRKPMSRWYILRLLQRNATRRRPSRGRFAHEVKGAVATRPTAHYSYGD
jgi:hypothetical protein